MLGRGENLGEKSCDEDLKHISFPASKTRPMLVFRSTEIARVLLNELMRDRAGVYLMY